VKGENNCPKCGKKFKVKSEQVLGIKNFFTMNYCPDCRVIRAVMPPLTTLKGKASRKIDRKTGMTRIRGISPEDWAKRDVMVKTFPRTIVTKPSEWKVYSRGRVHVTQQRTADVYPELSRGDIVYFSGFLNKSVLYATMMLNENLRRHTEFIQHDIKLKKGIFSSFKVKNPILVESEKMIEELIGKA
jgi:hypothetical protein